MTLPSMKAEAQLPRSPAQYLSSQKNDSISPADTVRSTIIRPDVSRESPRASLERFFMLTNDGHYDSAVIYLDLPDSMTEQGPEMARQLKAVLDRHLWIDLDSISSFALGDTADGLPAGVDELGSIVNSKGVRGPVRLVRWTRDDDARWRFSRGTVTRIPDWYSTLRDRWFLEHMPPSLLKTGPMGLLFWQWIALPVVLFLSIILGYLASKVLRRLIRRLVTRDDAPLVSTAIMRLGSPFTLACALISISLILPTLALYGPASQKFYSLLRAGFFISFVWGIWRIIDVLRQVADNSDWAQNNPASRALLPLGARTAKVFIFTIAFLTVFSLLGYPVASLIAGLGIGGLALALAAQKTVENLFGAFSLGVDQPFREGDFVKVEEFLGTVESIGLRSTRFRTLDRTLISIPNGQVAEMRLESYTARDRLRFSTRIGLMYGTTIAQTREIIEGFERVLRSHPQLWPDNVIVRLVELGDTSININVMAWFLTTDWSEFQVIRQNMLLQFMEVVEQAGARFAVPTRALRLMHKEENNGEMFDPGMFGASSTSDENS